MDPLRILASVLILLAVAMVATGGGLGYVGAQAADNVCDDPADCSGREARSDKLTDTGTWLMIGGFSTLLAACVLFAVPSLRRAS